MSDDVDPQDAKAVALPPQTWTLARQDEDEERGLRILRAIESSHPELTRTYVEQLIAEAGIRNDLTVQQIRLDRTRVENAYEIELRVQNRLDEKQLAELSLQKGELRQKWVATGCGSATMVGGVGVALALVLQGGDVASIGPVLSAATSVLGGLSVFWSRRQADKQ